MKIKCIKSQCEVCHADGLMQVFLNNKSAMAKLDITKDPKIVSQSFPIALKANFTLKQSKRNIYQARI